MTRISCFARAVKSNPKRMSAKIGAGMPVLCETLKADPRAVHPALYLAPERPDPKKIDETFPGV